MRKIILLALVAGFTMVSCDKKENTVVDETVTVEENGMAEEELPVGDNSRVSVDWNGTYEGTLPCADCEGIKTIITLNGDDTYAITTEYIGKDVQSEGKGNLVWSKDGGKITITGEDGVSTIYRVGENILIQLDQDGNPITGAMAGLYILRKK